jgi:hypothetical protein
MAKREDIAYPALNGGACAPSRVREALTENGGAVGRPDLEDLRQL